MLWVQHAICSVLLKQGILKLTKLEKLGLTSVSNGKCWNAKFIFVKGTSVVFSSGNSNGVNKTLRKYNKM